MPERRLLLVTSESFPPGYPSLREIYGRLLPERGYQVGMVFTDADTPGQTRGTWHSPGPLLRISATRGQLGGGLIAGQLRRRRETSMLRSEVELGRWDVVQVRDDPWLGLLFAKACRRSHTPFVFQLTHLKEEELLSLASRRLYGSPILNRLKAFVSLRMRSRVLNAADLVLAISDEMTRFLQADGVRSRVVALPEGASKSLVQAKPHRDDLRLQLGLGEGPVLVYVGTFSRTRGLEILFPVLRTVQRRHPTARLLMLGGARPEDRAFLERQARDEGVAESVKFAGPVDVDEVPAYIALATVGLSPMPTGLVLRMNSPIKLFEYLALGVPVVASDTPEQSMVLGATGAGFAVSHSVEAFSEAIARLLDNPQEAVARGRAGREYVERARTFDVLTERLAQEYEGLIKISHPMRGQVDTLPSG